MTNHVSFKFEDRKPFPESKGGGAALTAMPKTQRQEHDGGHGGPYDWHQNQGRQPRGLECASGAPRPF